VADLEAEVREAGLDAAGAAGAAGAGADVRFADARGAAGLAPDVRGPGFAPDLPEVRGCAGRPG
jgi:hypothetical protein